MEYIIFDCDGVLVDSEIESAKVVKEKLATFNIEISLDYHFRNFSGKTYGWIIENYMARGILPKNLAVEKIIKEIEYESSLNIKPMQNIGRALEIIKIPKVVVSNSDMGRIKHSLKTTGIYNHFHRNIFSATMVKKPKPSPDIYQYAVKKLKIDPNKCIVIEDSISGVTAAVAAGLNVIGFTGGSHIVKGHDDHLKQNGAFLTFNDMQILPEIIKKYQ